MNMQLLQEFLESPNTLCVLDGNEQVFSPKESILLPLLEYIDRFSHLYPQVTILDKTMGNAAALLSIKAGATSVYSPLGSKYASDTLSRYGREYHFTQTVPFILARNGKDMCPMEKLSLSRDMSPDEFYEEIKRHYKKMLQNQG